MRTWQYQEQARPVFVPPSPSYAWNMPWSEPIRWKKPNQDSYAAPVFVPPSPAYSWFLSWSEPIRWKKSNQDWYTSPVFSPVVNTPLSWLIAWPERLNVKEPKHQDELSAPVFVQPAPLYSWMVSWPDEILLGKRPLPNFSIFATPTFTPAVVAGTGKEWITVHLSQGLRGIQ